MFSLDFRHAVQITMNQNTKITTLKTEQQKGYLYTIPYSYPYIYIIYIYYIYNTKSSANINLSIIRDIVAYSI